MAVPIQNLRSGTATKRPVASGLAFGQVAVNYNEADPAVYLRGDANALIKVSPVFVGSLRLMQRRRQGDLLVTAKESNG
jgi:hypothetical protein